MNPLLVKCTRCGAEQTVADLTTALNVRFQHISAFHLDQDAGHPQCNIIEVTDSVTGAAVPLAFAACIPRGMATDQFLAQGGQEDVASS